MSSGLTKFTLKENSTWEDADGKLFVSISKVDSVMPITVTVGAIGCKNVQKAMITGDIIQYDASSHGTYEVRLRGSDGYASRAEFHIAKIA
jgi:hypothetical protein